MTVRLEMEVLWHLKLNAAQARIVLRALGGRLKTTEELEEAKKLGDELTRIRHQLSRNHAMEMEKHSSNIKEDPDGNRFLEPV